MLLRSHITLGAMMACTRVATVRLTRAATTRTRELAIIIETGSTARRNSKSNSVRFSLRPKKLIGVSSYAGVVLGGKFVPDGNTESALATFAKWAVVLIMTLGALIALALLVGVFYRDDALFRSLLKDHVCAIVGVPMAASSAFCVLLFFEARAGQVEFEALGFHFRGGSGPAIIWVFAFLAFVSAIRLLW
jgi:hypothetical protein